MKINSLKNLRILVIDDNHTIHEDIRRILMASSTLRASLDEDEAALFGDRTEDSPVPIFEIDSAYQGQEGMDLIEKSLREEWPYAMAFVDVRMPPGWDGVETTRRIWEKYPDLQVVLCTAYSDCSWEEMVRTKKWQLNLQAKHRLDTIEKIAETRTLALKAANVALTLTTFQLMEATEKSRRLAVTAWLSGKVPKPGSLPKMTH
jgi:CheY-like chemotaxis protein